MQGYQHAPRSRRGAWSQRVLRGALLAQLAIVLPASIPAHAQPVSSPQPPTPSEPARVTPTEASESIVEPPLAPLGTDGARLREALQRARDDAAKLQQEASAALAALDQGQSPREALAQMEPNLRRALMSAGARRGVERAAERRDADAPRWRPGAARDGLRALPADGPRGPRRDASDPQGLEARERLLGELRAQAPDIADALEAVRRDNSKIGEGLFLRAAPRLRDALSVRERDPQMARLKLDEVRGGLGVLRTIRAFREVKMLPDDAADRAARVAASEAAVREAVGKALDQRMAVQEHELAMLEQRVKDVGDDLVSKRERKSSVVDALMDSIRRGELPPSLFGEPLRRPGGERGPREQSMPPEPR